MDNGIIMVLNLKADLPMNPTLLQEFYNKYSREKVDEAIKYLSYKNPSVLPKVSPEVEASGQPILYVFRHGQTTDNADFLFSGWRDADLTDLGVEQAKILAEKLKDKKINRLYTSDQIRSIKTMKLAIALNEGAKNLPINKDPRIKERSYGSLQGHSKLEMQLKDPELLKLDRRSFSFVPPEGESIEMVCKRVKSFLDELVELMKRDGFNAAVSCHGNSMRGFRRYFEGLSDDETALVETPLAQDFASYGV